MVSSGKRFEIVHEQKTFAESTRILRARDTGLCYLQAWTGTAGGLTVLENPDGSPVVQHGRPCRKTIPHWHAVSVGTGWPEVDWQGEIAGLLSWS